jgi:hypothetical protein
MNVEFGAEAALFPEKEYISGIFVAVYCKCVLHRIVLEDALYTLYLIRFRTFKIATNKTLGGEGALDR